MQVRRRADRICPDCHVAVLKADWQCQIIFTVGQVVANREGEKASAVGDDPCLCRDLQNTLPIRDFQGQHAVGDTGLVDGDFTFTAKCDRAPL